jgi:hypothetical protein
MGWVFQMKTSYLILSLETFRVPKQVYHFERNSMIVFPSVVGQSVAAIEKDGVKIPCPCLGILVYTKEKKLSPEYIREKLDNFCTCLDLVSGDTNLIREFMKISKTITQDKISKEAKRAVALENVLKEHVRSDAKSKGFYLADFEKIECPFIINATFNFSIFFDKFLSVNKNSQTYRSIKLLLLINHITPLINDLYDNANLKNSLAYTLLESILPKLKTKRVYCCKKCGTKKEKEVNATTQERFSAYISKIPMSDDLRDRAQATFRCMVPIRSKFYHEAAYYEKDAEIWTLVEKLGKNWVDYKDDLKHNHGRIFGPLFLLQFLGLILLIRVLNHESETDLPEFRYGELWKYFRPFRMTESISVHWGNYVVKYHSVIKDFDDLRKRIRLCQNDGICSGFIRWQQPFVTGQDGNKILIVFYSPTHQGQSVDCGGCQDFMPNSLPGTTYQQIIRDLFKVHPHITYLVKCCIENVNDANKCLEEACGQFFAKEIDLLRPEAVLVVGLNAFSIIKKFKMACKVQQLCAYNNSKSQKKNVELLKKKWHLVLEKANITY